MGGENGFSAVDKLDVSSYRGGDSINIIGEERERTRGRIAVIALCIFGAEIIISFLFIGAKLASFSDIKEILGIMLPPTVGLVGAVTGFYYGSKRGR